MVNSIKSASKPYSYPPPPLYVNIDVHHCVIPVMFKPTILGIDQFFKVCLTFKTSSIIAISLCDLTTNCQNGNRFEYMRDIYLIVNRIVTIDVMNSVCRDDRSLHDNNSSMQMFTQRPREVCHGS